jgi:tetratricopeptide (TPR) repeat protein
MDRMKARPIIAAALLCLLPLPAVAGDVQVTVLRFLPRDADPDTAWIGAALADLVAAALTRTAGYVAVERERVEALLTEIDLAEKGITDAATAGRFARVAAADRAVLGSYAVRAGTVQVEATLVDATTGKALHTAKADGPISDLPVVAGRLAAAILGGRAPAPAAKVPTPPVEALADYYRGLRAEAEGDYPAAFIHLARAALTDPPHPKAGLDLGRLYARMGEPEHAVAAWRRYANGRPEDEAVAALLLAARHLERNVGDLPAAAAAYDDLATRYPLREDSWLYVTRGARLLDRAGDGQAVAKFLDRAVARIDAEIERVGKEMERAPDKYARRRMKSSLEPVRHSRWLIAECRRNLWFESVIAGRVPGSPPPDVHRLQGKSTARYDGDPRDVWLVAPEGKAISALTVSVTESEGPGADPSLHAAPWADPNGDGQFAPGDRHSITRPARVLRLGVWGRVASYTAEIQLVPHDGEPGPPTPEGAWPIVTGVLGAAQHPRLSRDREGRLHVVFADGQLRRFPPGAAGEGSYPAEPSSLYLATSADGGRTFGAPRRLPVSSEAEDAHPFLLHARDGTHHLVWISTRSEPQVAHLWYARSRDLEHWTYPRRIPFPVIASESGMAANRTFTAASTPELVEGPDRRIHLFAAAGWGAEGPGVYERSTADGLTWSEPRCVTAGETRFRAAVLPDGSFLLATRPQSKAATLRRSKDGRIWTSKEHRIPGAEIQTGNDHPPLPLVLESGRVALVEWLSVGHVALGVLGGRSMVHEIVGWPPQSGVAAGPDRVLVVVPVYTWPDRASRLLLLPLEVPE